jgi:hypothetical protein
MSSENFGYFSVVSTRYTHGEKKQAHSFQAQLFPLRTVVNHMIAVHVTMLSVALNTNLNCKHFPNTATPREIIDAGIHFTHPDIAFPYSSNNFYIVRSNLGTVAKHVSLPHLPVQP